MHNHLAAVVGHTLYCGRFVGRLCTVTRGGVAHRYVVVPGTEELDYVFRECFYWRRRRGGDASEGVTEDKRMVKMEEREEEEISQWRRNNMS